MEFNFKERYNIKDLTHIIEILRSEDGCPWDRKQTHKSIRRNFIEETYEVVEAIDNEDRELLLEELGDVLLQVVFHSRIEEEQQSFNFDDVCNGICQKLILRHPHVFSDVEAKDTEEVLKNWEQIKMKSKNQSSPTEAMESVARSLPALIRSEKVQKKAKGTEFECSEADTVLTNISIASGCLSYEIKENNRDIMFDGIGNLLFNIVNVARILDIDPEECLNKATDRKIEKFSEFYKK